MLFKNIAVLNENLDLQENMYVGIKSERIDYIGKEAPQGYDGDETYDGKDKLLMSGFYNTHTHSPMTLMRGYGGGLNLQDWLNLKIFPFEDHLDAHAVYWGTMLAMAESLKTGIVSSTDMYSLCDDIARAVLDAGAKMNISRGVVHFDDSDPYKTDRYAESLELIKAFPFREQGRLIGEASIHAEYTSNPKAVEAITKLATDNGTHMHIHLSETKSEHEECKARHGKTPARYFCDLGLFDAPTTAAHCVWLEDKDLDILAEKGVSAATNPVSNMKLASGIADIPAMQKKGIRVTLGTDGVSSNNSLNFFEEMKVMSLAAKVRSMDPLALPPKEVLRIATRSGALSQGRCDCGSLAAGNKADLIVIDLASPALCPIHDIADDLVYSASPSDVALTMVDGKILYKDGEFTTIDIEKTMAEVNKAVNRILGELK